jgi:hypothetical protein
MAVCEFSLNQTGVRNPEVVEALTVIRDEEEPSEALRLRLETLVQSLDDEQWTLQDKVDLSEATKEEHLAAFGRARAVNAVLCALEPDPLTAAAEATYEAIAATDDKVGIRDLISRETA